MSDSHKRYDSIRKALCVLWSEEAKGKTAKQMNVLASMICGIVGSKRTNYPSIANQAPGGIRLESKVKAYSRWVNAGKEDVEVHWMPFAGKLLVNLARDDRPLVLVMDGSEVGRKCLALMISVLYGGRALPLAWVVISGNAGQFPEASHIALCQAVQEVVPEGALVVFLGDGEFDGIGLLRLLDHFHWRYVCRTAMRMLLSHQGQRCAFVDLPLARGQRWELSDISFTKQDYGPLLAIGWWRKDCQHPIYLISNLTTMEEAYFWYAKRFHIETFFSDQKSRGFFLHKSHLAHPQRLARLLLAATLAYVWIVFLGDWARKTRLSRIIHRTDRCDLSLFQLGLRTLHYLLNHHLPIPVSFSLFEYVF